MRRLRGLRAIFEKREEGEGVGDIRDLTSDMKIPWSSGEPRSDVFLEVQVRTKDHRQMEQGLGRRPFYTTFRTIVVTASSQAADQEERDEVGKN